MSESPKHNHTRIIHGSPGWYRFLIVGFVILLIINIGGFLYFFSSQGSVSSEPPEDSAADEIVAVQMTNGQVYYGSIVEENEEALKLKDVYYFKKRIVNVEPQKDQNDLVDVAAGNTDGITPPPQTKKQLVLAKLDTHISGKSDLVINKRNVLSWQPLAHTSPVYEAIGAYMSSDQ